MKNNRILTAILATLLLASALASCTRRDQFRPDETDALTGEQTTVAGQPDVNHPTDTNPNGGDVTGPNTSTPDSPIGDPSTGDAETARSRATLTRAGRPRSCMRLLWRIKHGRRLVITQTVFLGTRLIT